MFLLFFFFIKIVNYEVLERTEYENSELSTPQMITASRRSLRDDEYASYNFFPIYMYNIITYKTL